MIGQCFSRTAGESAESKCIKSSDGLKKQYRNGKLIQPLIASSAAFLIAAGPALASFGLINYSQIDMNFDAGLLSGKAATKVHINGGTDVTGWYPATTINECFDRVVTAAAHHDYTRGQCYLADGNQQKFTCEAYIKGFLWSKKFALSCKAA